ncbi:MAG: GNAT family N-acetyltransferase [Clostridia bacterium]|nr:GNAT family N-acetyltransferase [Clostridia bacterium]
MQLLTTHRLVLRKPKETDVRFFHQLSSDPLIALSAGWLLHDKMKQSINTLNDFSHDGGIWAIVDRLTNNMIGIIGLVDDPKRNNPKAKMIGYALHEDFWGQGIATEACRAVVHFGFNALNLDLICAYIYTYNNRSKKTLANCNFRLEGVLRKTNFINGQYLDEACFSLTRQEYIKDNEQNFK